jgi:hypothetical protein
LACKPPTTSPATRATPTAQFQPTNSTPQTRPKLHIHTERSHDNELTTITTTRATDNETMAKETEKSGLSRGINKGHVRWTLLFHS